MLTREEVLRAVKYIPETGKFIWQRGRRFGDEAGSPDGRYIKICINYKRVYAHRLAWFLVYGSWPSKDIDHANGNCLDNRIENLREATSSQNLANSRLASSNSTGFKGVHYDSRNRRYRAFFQHKPLGRYDTPEEAHAAYCKAALQTAGEFARFR